MTQEIFSNNAPLPRAVWRLHPGLLLEVCGPTHTSVVQLDIDSALGLAQSLLFDVREARRRPELTTFATEARHCEALQRAERTFNETEARHQAAVVAAGKALR